jgi:outer membrane protein insertion porin family
LILTGVGRCKTVRQRFSSSVATGGSKVVTGRLLSIGFLLSLLLAPSAWGQAGEQKVVIAPFKIHSQEPLPNIQTVIRDTLSQQLKDEGLTVVDAEETRKALAAPEPIQTETQAQSLGRRLQASQVIFGSLSKVGNHISIDARLVDVFGQKKTEILVADEEGLENLAAACSKISQQVAVHVLAKAVIAEVRVQGNERIEAEAVKSVAKSARGEVLRPAQVRDDIKAIYQMGYFEEVKAEVTDSPTGKILTFVVQEKPTVQEVRIKGNKKIKENDILSALHTKPYTVLQRNVINEDVQRITKLYHDKAYFNVDVKTTVDFPRDPRQAVVTFSIVENQKIYIKKITFTGNKYYSARTLRGVMETKEEMFLLTLLSDRGVLQQDKLNTDVDRLTAYYHDNGFMDAQVGTPVVSREKDGFTISIPISEGGRYRVASVAVTGDLLDNQEKLDKHLETKPKAYFSREKLRHDIDYLTKKYMDEGYAYAEIAPQVKRDQENHTTTIDYQVKKGNKVHMERIAISGNTKTKDNVIRREIQLAEGDTFSGAKLEQSSTNLRKLDFFETVEISPSEGSQPDAMNLSIKVKEKTTGTISIGGGFSSDDGLFAGGEITQRNLFGRGQSLALKAQLSTKAARYSLSFFEPSVLDSLYSAGFDIYKWNREYPDFTKDSEGFVARVGHPFGEYSHLALTYNLENANVTDISNTTDPFLVSQEGQELKSSVTVSAWRDTTDSRLLPTRGSMNTIAVEMSSPLLGSESDFVTYTLSSGWFIPLYWKLVGYVRGKFGYIEEIQPVPIYERFFLGGINSHRGYNFGELGPTDPDGNKIGGMQFGLFTVELLFPLVEKLGMRGVFFMDTGNSFLGSESFDFGEFKTAVGPGLVWASPFGPFRVFWAYNLTREPSTSQSKFQFAMGYYF